MSGPRKFSEAVTSLRGHGWRAGLRWFLAEFLVVVVGVLVALAVSAWWQTVKDREHEQSYLHQLDSDLLATENEMGDAHSRLIAKARAAAVIAHAFWGERPATEGELREAFTTPWASARYRPVLGNIDALIATGDIDVIRSAPLRTELVSYVEWTRSRLDDINRFDETYYRPAVNELLSRLDPNSMIAERVRKLGAGRAHGMDLRSVAATGDPPFPVDVDAVLKDRVVYNAYEKMLLAHRNQAAEYGRILERARRLHAQVYRQLHGIAEPGNCQLERKTRRDDFAGTCGALVDGPGIEVDLRLHDAAAIVSGTWKSGETPADVMAGTMAANGVDEGAVELEVSRVGDGVLRTTERWFAVRALAYDDDRLRASFRLDMMTEVPPNALDVAILVHAKSLLADASSWDRHDDRQCAPDKPQISLYCALVKATTLESGGFHHRRPALQLVRQLVDARTEGRGYEHRLRDYNNDPRTTLAEVQTVFDEAIAKAKTAQAEATGIE